MKLKTRHILFALMVLITSAPFLLPAMLVFQRTLAVHEMTEKLEREELQEIRIDRDQIRWVKPGKELWIGSRMFDVKEIQEDGSSLILKGLYDDEEKRIISKMGSLSAPLPYEKERSSTIYQLTHLETALLQLARSFPPDLQCMKFPPLQLHLPTEVQDNCYPPPEMI